MMGTQAAPERLFYDFCLEEHVPDDHLLRRNEACPMAGPSIVIKGSGARAPHKRGDVSMGQEAKSASLLAMSALRQ